MHENKFQKKVIDALKKRPVFIINLHGHLMQRAGLPDLKIIHSQWHGFLELKVGVNKPNAIQKAVAKKIAARGVPVYILRCVEEDYSGLGDTYCKYTLEDFKGKVIKYILDLNDLLNTLIRLKKGKDE